MILAVDFAARFSAYVLMDINGTVLLQGDSWKCSEEDFLSALTCAFESELYDTPIVLALEDLPYALRFDTGVQKVCRMQGRVIDRMNALDMLDRLLFIQPAEWMRATPGVWKEKPDVVVPVAEALYGYTPPIDWRSLHKEERIQAKKLSTDYSAAYLMARYLLDRHLNGLSLEGNPKKMEKYHYQTHAIPVFDEKGNVVATDTEGNVVSPSAGSSTD